jgi:hypothetical protein
MIKDGEVVKTIMRSFSLNEISAVDRPAQQKATVAIMKREESPTPAENEIQKMDVSMALTTMTAGHSHMVLLGGGAVLLRAGDTSIVDDHCHPWIKDEAGNIMLGHALGHSHGIEVISKREFTSDERAEAASSKEAMPDGSFPIENVSDLNNAIAAFGRAKDQTAVARHITKRAAALGATDLLPSSGVLANLLGKNYIDANNAESIGTSEVEMTNTSSEAADATTAEQIEELTKRAERAEAIASLSNEHREYLSVMKAEDADAFLFAEASERNKQVSKAAEANSIVFTDEDGVSYRKSDDPRLISMAKAVQEEKSKRKKMEREAYNAGLEKRASELSHIPGTVETHMALLKGLDSLPETERKSAFESLKAQDASLGKAFNRVGTAAVPTEDAELDPLDQLAAEVSKRDNVSFEQAYTVALTTKEGQKLYNRHVAKRHGNV